MILRNGLIQRSIRDFVSGRLPEFDYNPGVNLLVRDAFPTPDERAEPLEETTLAFGFHFDDGGVPMELGSTLTRYTHTVELWVFALNDIEGPNLAEALKIVGRRDYHIPLLDYNARGAPEIATLEVDRASVTRQINPQPRPWDQFVWTCTYKVFDDHLY